MLATKLFGERRLGRFVGGRGFRGMPGSRLGFAEEIEGQAGFNGRGRLAREFTKRLQRVTIAPRPQQELGP